jgi:hypothetical protein
VTTKVFLKKIIKQSFCFFQESYSTKVIKKIPFSFLLESEELYQSSLRLIKDLFLSKALSFWSFNLKKKQIYPFFSEYFFL